MTKKRLFLTLFIVVVSIVFQLCSVSCKDTTPTPPKTNRIQLWKNGYWYLLGVNYPWLNYAHDFGATVWGYYGVSADASCQQIDADFTYLKSHGVHIVRWFLLGDCRAAPEFADDRKVTGFDEYFYPDLDAALTIARKHNIYLIKVLFDFHLADKAKQESGVQLGGRPIILIDSTIRQSFLDNAPRPLLQRYSKNRNIIAWEVMNEPEGAITISGGKLVEESVSLVAMKSFVKALATFISIHPSTPR